ncbi:hypothetical protein M407DRAFT_72627 [Tulasnella calospora MUT 4182]|uniref:Alginate lyase domain-containing protein n=1 Tax=Tulasnella calospora MUT 4182 TaxID=1051891 RepID=A0A0C3L212_9AGAM|nr:hypothetical protein M407DRAFT_72627 [Tulasnella calospora MUT 4182]
MVSFKSLATFGLTLAATSAPVHAFSSYISQWLPVNYTTEGGWDNRTFYAQQEIVAAAKWWSDQGPWSVLNKTFTAPTNNTHDYLSWAPYYWADCSNVQNTTELTPQQVWEECNYVNRDGQFSPDVRLVNDTGNFQAMSDAVFYNTLAYKITGDESYAQKTAWFIDTWFTNNATFMNPNLNWAQVMRGANGSHGGQHTGVLDLHGMTKVVSAILVLRALASPSWTPQLDAAMNDWSTQYVNWLLTNDIALGEKAATNNHGSFYFSQTASIQVLIGDYAGARTTLQEYFEGIYLNQITADGDQPLESARTRPYHYRAYNAAAIITINRIADYIGWNTWNITTKAGVTVKEAVDFAMTKPAGDEAADELYPDVAAIGSQFNDPDGKYSSWLAQQDNTYPGQAYFLWEQPFTDSGLKVYISDSGSVESGTPPANSGSNGSNGSNNNNAAAALSPSPMVSFAVAALFGAVVAAAL